MRVLTLLNLVLLPILVSSAVIKYEPAVLNNATLIRQVHYMFDNKTAPASGDPGDGESYIQLEVTAKKADEKLPARAVIEVMVASDEVFNSIGVYEKDKHYMCCDDQAFDDNQCTNHNRLWVRSPKTTEYRTNSIEFTGETKTVSVRFDIPKEGKYYIAVGMCDPDTQNVLLNTKAIVMNPYGHIPARMYGIMPFTKFILIAYTLLMIIWIIRCCGYRKELMSVHMMITVVLVTFLFDVIMKLVMLTSYNTNGEYPIKLTMFSLSITAATHSVARCLTLMVAMGLGVSKASLAGSLWKIIVMGIVYFGFSLWDSVSTTFATASQVSLWRIIPASLLDSLIYFWILQSLLDTIQELEDKKQTGKLDVFINLRNMIIVAVIISTIYNIVFSYLIVQKKVESLWKYQWFFSDGIWSSFYLVVICAIMYLWAPNERSLAYAYHVQVATDERQDTEEYAMQEQESLQSNVEGSVKVATVEATEESLKPMSIKPQV